MENEKVECVDCGSIHFMHERHIVDQDGIICTYCPECSEESYYCGKEMNKEVDYDTRRPE